MGDELLSGLLIRSLIVLSEKNRYLRKCVQGIYRYGDKFCIYVCIYIYGHNWCSYSASLFSSGNYITNLLMHTLNFFVRVCIIWLLNIEDVSGSHTQWHSAFGLLELQHSTLILASQRLWLPCVNICLSALIWQAGCLLLTCNDSCPPACEFLQKQDINIRHLSDFSDFTVNTSALCYKYFSFYFLKEINV